LYTLVLGKWYKMSELEKGNKKQKLKGGELQDFVSVKNWIESLEQTAISRGKCFTHGAKRQRLSRLLDYSRQMGLTPDQLFEEAKQDIDKAGKRLSDFFQERIKKGIGWNSAVTDIAFLRGFYTHNDLRFPKRFPLPKSKVSAVSQRDAKTEIYSYDEDSDKLIFHNGTLQHFISNLNFRDQTIALCLLSTGADATDLLNLNIGFIKDGKGRVSSTKRFLWRGNRAKDGIEFKVYFSDEATQFLKRYVEQERASTQDNEPLFIKEDGLKLPAHALAMNFRVAAGKMGYTTDDESNPFRPKRFRHLFRTACGNATVDPGFVMAFMGHASNTSALYLEKSDGLFLKEYVKAEPYITVFGVDKSSVTELSEELSSLIEWKTQTEMELSSTKDKTIKLYDKTEELRKQNSELEETVKSLTSRVEFFNTFVGLVDVVETEEDAKEVTDFFEIKRLRNMARARVELEKKEQDEKS
jgi:integrase